MTLSRRNVLRQGAMASGVLAIGNMSALFNASPAAAATRSDRLGPLVRDPAGLLDLPEGFRYTVLSEVGNPTSNGGLVGDKFDGGAAFRGRHRLTYYVRNHELEFDNYQHLFIEGPSELTYDTGATGGTTTLVIEDGTRVVDEYVSLAGTVKNCAGGITPWGTWLTCEETSQSADDVHDHDHGYVFEVDPAHPENNVDPQPLVALGRFQHEAVAIDRRTGEAYMTEDDSYPHGGVYRFIPNVRPRGYGAYRHGGTLLAMRCFDGGEPVANFSPYSKIGTTLRVEWVPVPDPEAHTLVPLREQLPGDAMTRARKLEGIWWAQRDNVVYFTSSYARFSDGSPTQHDGQVWSYDPQRQQVRLEIRFELNPDPHGNETPNGPDNIMVTPWGGLLLAEDHGGAKHLYAADLQGNVVPFARNRLSNNEMAGQSFSPDGQVLYTSVFVPGMTFAIEGPFERLGNGPGHRRAR